MVKTTLLLFILIQSIMVSVFAGPTRGQHCCGFSATSVRPYPLSRIHIQSRNGYRNRREVSTKQTSRTKVEAVVKQDSIEVRGEHQRGNTNIQGSITKTRNGESFGSFGASHQAGNTNYKGTIDLGNGGRVKSWQGSIEHRDGDSRYYIKTAGERKHPIATQVGAEWSFYK